MTRKPAPFGLLLAAHGERRVGAANESIARLATALAARRVAREIGFGFINGEPSLSSALSAFASDKIVVWPLFLCEGHFARVRLRQLLADGRSNGGRRTISLQTPLGLDPALPGLIAARAAKAAQRLGRTPAAATIVLLAHGSGRDTDSRIATEKLAGEVRALGLFGEVRVAFLEEAPALSAATASTRGPVVVVGLFVGEGSHGGGDVPRLIAVLNRPSLVFAGNIGSWPELAELAADLVHRMADVGTTSETAIQARGKEYRDQEASRENW